VGKNSLQTLKVKTVRVYIAAIAEIYHTQVSLGLNKSPNFRGVALKALMKDLSRKQAQQRQDAFEDRGAKSLNTGYTAEQLLHLQDRLLLGAQGSSQVSWYTFALLHNLR
jgi:hypothetical protein